MAKLGTIDWKGRSGTAYQFEVYNLNSNWNSVARVYIVSRAVSNDRGGISHTPIYVGQTENLKQRFADHHKAMCFERYSANRLCILIENSEQRRLDIETDLIHSLKPPCND